MRIVGTSRLTFTSASRAFSASRRRSACLWRASSRWIAAVLAESAARAATNLVEINLATMLDDERLVSARRLVSESEAHVRRAVAESR